MNTFYNRAAQQSSNVFSYLDSDQDFQIKQSVSAEFIEMDAVAVLNSLYEYVFTNPIPNSVQLPSLQYRTETQTGKLMYIRQVCEYLLHGASRENQQDTNEIHCEDCKNYETHLQKLENQIRQHIRLEQQLKLYQESLQEKIEDHQKQQEKITVKLSKLKEIIDELKAKENGYNHKISRLEEENERFKHEINKNKSGLVAENSHRANRENSQTKTSFKALHEMKEKENMVFQKASHRKDEKLTERKEDKIGGTDKKQRKSIEKDKRTQSSEKWRQSHTNSIKHLGGMAQKIVSDKNREERRKAIQAKFQLRR